MSALSMETPSIDMFHPRSCLSLYQARLRFAPSITIDARVLAMFVRASNRPIKHKHMTITLFECLSLVYLFTTEIQSGSRKMSVYEEDENTPTSATRHWYFRGDVLIIKREVGFTYEYMRGRSKERLSV